MLGFTVLAVDGSRLGTVVIDQRQAVPRNRLVIDHGQWLWRRQYVVARAHVRDADFDERIVCLDLDRRRFLEMPRW